MSKWQNPNERRASFVFLSPGAGYCLMLSKSGLLIHNIV